MNKKNVLFIALFTVVFALSSVNVMAQGAGGGMGKHKKTPPFLITGKLPHLTKMLMQQWENPELQLTEEQKSKLMVVRQDTMSGAQKLGQEIAVLEDQVAAGIDAGKKPEELESVVKTIADLKTEATMLHLRCIYNTKAILDARQLGVLKAGSGK